MTCASTVEPWSLRYGSFCAFSAWSRISRPFASVSPRVSRWNHCRILLRAREDAARLIQSRDGPRPALRQRLHLALRREDVDLVVEEVGAERLHELARVGLVLLPVHQRLDPGEPVVVLLALAALVEPVRRDPILRLLVHLARAHLDLERRPLRPDHG